MMKHDVPPLREYQASDIDDLVSRWSRGERALFMHHEQGLGKSRISMEVVDRIASDRRLLILCPAIGRISWADEFERWSTRKPLILTTGAKAKRITPGVSVIVCGFDLTRNVEVRDALREWANGAVCVLDEYQYLRNPDAKRTAAIYGFQHGVLRDVEGVILMSGTPQVGWPIDWWCPLARWQPERLRDGDGYLTQERFKHRYHVVRQMPNPRGRGWIEKLAATRNLDDLHARMEGMAIRRTKFEADLPDLLWLRMPIELAAKDRKAMDEAFQEHLPGHVLAKLRRAAADPHDTEAQREAERAVESHKSLMPVILRALGVAKAHAVSRIIAEELDNGLPAVGVGALNHAVLDVIGDALRKYGVVRIDGSTSEAAKSRAKSEFMRPDGPRVFSGQIAACGTALTLTRASEVVMLQVDWLPGANAQFASRFHRIGQHSDVRIRVPVVPGTIDDPIMRIILRKTEAMGYLTDGVGVDKNTNLIRNVNASA